MKEVGEREERKLSGKERRGKEGEREVERKRI